MSTFVHCFFCCASNRAPPPLPKLGAGLLLLLAAVEVGVVVDEDDAVKTALVLVGAGTAAAAADVTGFLVVFLLAFFGLGAAFEEDFGALVVFVTALVTLSAGGATPCGSSFPRGPAGTASLMTGAAGGGIGSSTGRGGGFGAAVAAFVALASISLFFLVRDSLSFSLGCVGFAFLGTTLSDGALLEATGGGFASGGGGGGAGADGTDNGDLLAEPDCFADNLSFNFGFFGCCDCDSAEAAGVVAAFMGDDGSAALDGADSVAGSLSFSFADGLLSAEGFSAFFRSFATTFNMSFANFVIHLVSRLL